MDLSFRALSGRLEFTGRRHKFNKDSLLLCKSREHQENPKWEHYSSGEGLATPECQSTLLTCGAVRVCTNIMSLRVVSVPV